jgi:hypothetical protein
VPRSAADLAVCRLDESRLRLFAGTTTGIFDVCTGGARDTHHGEPDLKPIRWLMLTAILVLAQGCGPEAPAVMERGKFIDVIVELRRAEHEGVQVAQFEVRRDEILEEAGVTDSMLVEFARVHGRDAEFMAAVWDSIDRVVNNVVPDDAEIDPDGAELEPDTAR